MPWAHASSPSKFWRDVLEDALDDVRVVLHAQLVRHRQEQRVGGGDSFVFGELFDERLGFRCVRAAEDGACVGVDVADLILTA